MIPSRDSGVDPSYRHEPKNFGCEPPLELPGALLKWYGLHTADLPIPEEISLLAREGLASDPPAASGLGFVILHRCGMDFYFLIVCTWRNSNELWESVLYKNGDAMKGFEVFPRQRSHLATLSVWELAPVLREKEAWGRFLRSPRDEAAGRFWLSDCG